MHHKMIGFALITIAASAAAIAQSRSADWVGIWHANAGGRPTSMLTLATDTGHLGGTLVLDMIGDERGQPRVIASEPHVLLDPLVAGSTLTFQVKMQRSDGKSVVASFLVTRTAADKATIHCVNCGADAPVVDLVKGL
jgi:hypothetical protein